MHYYLKRSLCPFISILFTFKACQHKRTHLMRCAFNWIHFCLFGHGPLIPCVFKIPILLEISFFFQIKGIISSQKNILVQRKAIISLARMWNATNDRTNKEQARSNPGRMRLRARAYALLLFKRLSLRSGRRQRPCEVFPIRVWGGVSWAHSFPPRKSLLTYFILGRTTVFISAMVTA